MTLSVRHPVEAPPLTLGRLVVLVHDYDKALAFYRAAFDARVLFDAPGPIGGRYLHIGFGVNEATADDGILNGAAIWLMRASGESAQQVGRQTGGEPLAVFYTADARAAIARAAAAGAAIVRELESAEGASFAHVADLYGNVFVLVELASAAG